MSTEKVWDSDFKQGGYKKPWEAFDEGVADWNDCSSEGAICLRNHRGQRRKVGNRTVDGDE